MCALYVDESSFCIAFPFYLKIPCNNAFRCESPQSHHSQVHKYLGIDNDRIIRMSSSHVVYAMRLNTSKIS